MEIDAVAETQPNDTIDEEMEISGKLLLNMYLMKSVIDSTDPGTYIFKLILL